MVSEVGSSQSYACEIEAKSSEAGLVETLKAEMGQASQSSMCLENHGGCKGNWGKARNEAVLRQVFLVGSRVS